MADNVTYQSTVATPPSGTVVSTEEVTTLNGAGVTAQQMQRVGIAIRLSDGIAIDLPGDATNGLDTDVTRVIPGTGATHLGKAEDAAHSSGDTGVMALGVRKDADGAFGADLDYSPFQLDDNGFLKVNIKAGAGAGGTSMTDDAAFTVGSTGINPMGALFDDSSPDSVNEGDAGIPRMAANRVLYVQLRDADGNERGVKVNAAGWLQVKDDVNEAYTASIDNTLALAHPSDDTAFVIASGLVHPIAGLFDDVTPDSVNEGDVGAVRMAENRVLYVQIRDAAGNERGLNIDASGGITMGAIVPGTGATNLGKAEDAAHSSGDVGIMALGVRKDADGAFGADGDYTPLQLDDNGFLKVNIKAGAGAGGTSMVDDAAFTPGTTSITPMGAMFDNVATDSVDEGDAGVVRMSGNRNLYIQIRDAAGNERGANVNASSQLVVNDPDAVNLLTTIDTTTFSIDSNLGTLLGIINASNRVDDAAFTPATDRVAMLGAFFDDVAPDSVSEGDGGAVRMSGNRNLYVTIRDAAGNERGLNIDANGAIAVAQATASNLNAQAVGNIAHDGVDSGNPIKIGLKAIAHGSNPTAVAAADRTDWYANRHGVPFVIGGHPRIIRICNNYTAAQTDTVLQSVSAGQIFIVTQLSAFVDNANTVDVGVFFEFDDGTDIKISQHPGLAAGSGYAEGSGSGILAIGGDGMDLLVTCEVPTTGSITIAVSGYLIES